MKASDFDTQFDNRESILPYAELDKAERPSQIKRVNVDFPLWMIEGIDNEAKRIGITRQSLIKVWLADCLKDKVAQ